LKDPKISTKNLLDLINTFSKVAGYKNQCAKPVTFLYTNNEPTEIEIRRVISFTIASKLTDLDYENYKSPKKEINENIRRWKVIPCSCIIESKF
jgi:hypothetical protein